VNAFLELLNNLTDPDWIVTHGGLYLLLFIVFAETGILIGFFLPGDPILFIAGIIIANLTLSPIDSILMLAYWVALISAAAVGGNFVGYFSGNYFGHRLLRGKDTWLVKTAYIQRAHAFYQQRGGVAIILARFLPVVRTFAPIVAGAVRMDLRKFAFYNIIGALVWVASLVTLGYLLGENDWVQRNLEYVILGIVVVATAPVLTKLFAGKRKTAIADERPVPEEEEAY